MKALAPTSRAAARRSPQRGSYPSKHSPRQQQVRITAALALLPLSSPASDGSYRSANPQTQFVTPTHARRHRRSDAAGIVAGRDAAPVLRMRCREPRLLLHPENPLEPSCAGGTDQQLRVTRLGPGRALPPPMPLTHSRPLLPARRAVLVHCVFKPTRRTECHTCRRFAAPKLRSASSWCGLKQVGPRHHRDGAVPTNGKRISQPRANRPGSELPETAAPRCGRPGPNALL